MASMRQEFQKKYDEYNAKQKDWLPAVLEAKTKELQTLQQNITQFQQSAQNDYSNMQQKLFAPVVKKARDAVNKIGKEKGFIYITDISIGSLIYINETQSVNIMPMAKKDLGISADKKVFDPTAAAGASSGVK
jgi:outer membrane protein